MLSPSIVIITIIIIVVVVMIAIGRLDPVIYVSIITITTTASAATIACIKSRRSCISIDREAIVVVVRMLVILLGFIFPRVSR